MFEHNCRDDTEVIISALHTIVTILNNVNNILIEITFLLSDQKLRFYVTTIYSR